MADNFLILHLNSIEENLKTLIQEFFYQLTDINIDIHPGKMNELILFLKKENNKNEYLIKKLEDNVVEFNILIDVLHHLHSNNQTNTMSSRGNGNNINLQQILNSTFTNRMLSLITQELKLFRNLIHHEKNIDDELVQRFFEDVYYYFKNIKFPKYQRDIFSDFIKKEVIISLKCVMNINLQNNYSFQLDYSKYEEMLNQVRNIKINSKKALEDDLSVDFSQDNLNFIYQHNIKTKLLDFNFKLTDITGSLNYDYSNAGSHNNRLLSYSSLNKDKESNMNGLNTFMNTNTNLNFGLQNTNLRINSVSNSMTHTHNTIKFGDGNISAELPIVEGASLREREGDRDRDRPIDESLGGVAESIASLESDLNITNSTKLNGKSNSKFDI
jgi:hypothetical protein